MVLGEIIVHHAAVRIVQMGILFKGETYAPNNTAFQLIFAGSLVQQQTYVIGGHDASHLYHPGGLVDCNLGENSTPAMGGECPFSFLAGFSAT